MPPLFPRLSFNRFGDPAQVLELQQMSRPLLRPGQRLLQMRYAPINPSDLIPIHGHFYPPSTPTNSTPLALLAV